MVIIAKQSDYDKDFDSYLNKRRNGEKSSFSFFKAVESLIPSKSKKSTENIIYDDTEKTSFLTKLIQGASFNQICLAYFDSN